MSEQTVIWRRHGDGDDWTGIRRLHREPPPIPTPPREPETEPDEPSPIEEPPMPIPIPRDPPAEPVRTAARPG